MPYPIQRLLTGPDSLGHPITTLGRSRSHTLLESRYHHEFEELSTLGRGGYGIVYRVRHRLDNQTYAIKKVPLSAGRLQRIQRRGQPELEEVLREVRTLARLDHPNIVRYYGGWIEWVDEMTTSDHAQSMISLVSGSQAEDTMAGARDSSESMRRVTTESSADGTEIIFEDSHTTQKTGHSFRKNETSTDEIPLRRVGTKSTTATVSDEAIQSIDRSIEDPSFSIQSAVSGINFTEPTLALHVQMSLHPMTLADFLAPPSPSNTTNNATLPPTLSHCFHLDPSLSILLSILDGLEYLHGEGIVHRDIKPANIFLGPHSNPRATRGSVDLLLCNDCRAEHTVNPIRLEVRIGDFGLVSVADPNINDSTAVSSASLQRAEIVGTELYRPMSMDHAMGSQLDVYALGVVAFELLWKFGTKMERLHCIQQLKEDCFPNGFLTDVDAKRSKGVKNCIRAMLASESMSVRKVRQMLTGLQAP